MSETSLTPNANNETGHSHRDRFSVEYHWSLHSLTADETSASLQLEQDLTIPHTIASLLVARGLRTSEQARHYLEPSMEQLVDPFLMLGMEQAVLRLEKALATGETILIYGDYDVDGTTAIVLLKTALEILGGKVLFHVPHRLKDGYGMRSSVLEEAAAKGVHVVVSVDTGMRAVEEAETALRLGLDLIVTDHHLPSEQDEAPRAYAVLNPNQKGCPYPTKALCGAGIAFKLAQALLERKDPQRTREKLLPSFLKMLAIATVADAVPLLDENRMIVSLGLEQLQRPVGAGLRALMQTAKLDPAAKPITATDIGFRLGPRVNAAGRMDVAGDVVELFTTRDHGRAVLLADKLEKLNQDRRNTEAAALAEIDEMLEQDESLESDRLLLLCREGWHRGVLGILASRVVERTCRPALVGDIEKGEIHASGRSVHGFHLLRALESCADLFTRFGGHEHAVGFTMPAEHLQQLRQRLQEYAAQAFGSSRPSRTILCHTELPLNRITPPLWKWISRMEPFGHGNPEPVFMARGVRLVAPPRVMKERHVRLRVAEGPNDAGWNALGWNCAARCEELGLQVGSQLDLAFKLRENSHPEFGGLELEIAGLYPAK